jgi:hypothetical protein
MMHFFLKLFLTIATTTTTSLLNKRGLFSHPKCAECIHYIPNLSSMNFTSTTSKCNLFHKIYWNKIYRNKIYRNKIYRNKIYRNKIYRNKIYRNKNSQSAPIVLHEYADLCRANEAKCGERGVFFVEERFLRYKIVLHAIISGFPVFLLFSSLVLLISITDYIHNQ